MAGYAVIAVMMLLETRPLLKLLNESCNPAVEPTHSRYTRTSSFDEQSMEGAAVH